MGTVRIRGIARLADMVRRQLAGPVSPAALERLRSQVVEALEQLDLALADEGLHVQDMAASSRKAYEFLKGVDFSAVETSPGAGDEWYARGAVRLTGLRGFVTSVLDDLAAADDAPHIARIHEALRGRHEAIEDLMARQEIRPEHLKDDSQSLRAWLAYFARRDNLDRYAAAVARARPAFEREALASGRYRPPVRVQFAPMRGIYRLRAERDGGMRAVLPTPMITFPAEAFGLLAAMALRKAPTDEAVMDHMLRPAYQDVLAELEELAGGGDCPRGVHHDLAAAFDRVNAEYFASALPRPRLVWGRAMAMRKFGHYDRVHDTVLLSSSLDAAGVPPAAVDFVVYHELLHRQLGVDWRNGRRAVHTGEFRRRERAFRQYVAAQAALDKLARGR